MNREDCHLEYLNRLEPEALGTDEGSPKLERVWSIPPDESFVWDETTELSRCASPPQAALTRHLTRPGPQLRCPQCDSIIYSRRHKLCGVCAQELPPKFLFPAEDAQRLQVLMVSEQRRHRAWIGKTLDQALAPSFMSLR